MVASYLTSELKENFDKDGVVIIRKVFSKDWLEKTKIAIEQNMASPSQYGENVKAEGGSGSYFNDYLNWQRIPELLEYVYKSPAAEIAKFLTGSQRIVFYHEHILVKEPNTTKTTPWHHDQSYYPLDGDQVCSIWMPVDHVSKSETLYFVKGSHKKGYFMPYKFATELPYPLSDPNKKEETVTFTPIPENIEELGEVVGWEVAPGDCVVFAGKTVHGAPGNLSARPRRVLSTRWVGDDVVCAERPWVCSPPVTGNLKSGERFQQDDLFPFVDC